MLAVISVSRHHEVSGMCDLFVFLCSSNDGVEAAVACSLEQSEDCDASNESDDLAAHSDDVGGTLERGGLR